MGDRAYFLIGGSLMANHLLRGIGLLSAFLRLALCLVNRPDDPTGIPAAGGFRPRGLGGPVARHDGTTRRNDSRHG